MIKTIGHRGFGLFDLENTLPAFKKALDSGLDMVEMDVSLSADGQIIVYHDKTLKRLAGINKKVSEIDFSILSKVRIHSPRRAPFYFHGQIPLLEEVLELCKGNIELDIELKASNENNQLLVEKVLALIAKHKMQDDVLLTSFSRDILAKIRQQDKSIKTGYIVVRLAKSGLEFAIDNNIEVILPNVHSLKKKHINAIRKSGKEIFVWTVNSGKSIRKLIKSDVDGIITNLPLNLINTVISEYLQ